MAIMKSCCCGRCSIRSGSFCAALYATIYFTITLIVSVMSMVGIAHIENQSLGDARLQHHSQLDGEAPIPEQLPKGLLALLLVLASLGIISSIMLVFGLIKERRWLLVPLICTLATTVVTEIAVLIMMAVQDKVTEQPLDGSAVPLLIIDAATLSVNLWCILCVVSQYQLYAADVSQQKCRRGFSYQAPLTVGTDTSAVPTDLSQPPALTVIAKDPQTTAGADVTLSIQSEPPPTSEQRVRVEFQPQNGAIERQQTSAV